MTNETIDALLNAPTNQVPLTTQMLKNSVPLQKKWNRELTDFLVTDAYLKEHPELQKFLVKPSKGKD